MVARDDETDTETRSVWCATNDCDQEECHRCFPREGCHDHEKCVTEGHAIKQRKIMGEIMRNPSFTQGEKRVVEYQFRELPPFMATLMKAIHLADDKNKAKLALAYPEEVAAVRRWQEGDLGQVFRGLGLEI
jgi:hypothetical protein